MKTTDIALFWPGSLSKSCLVALGLFSCGAAFAQPANLGMLATPDERFAFAVGNVVGISEGVSIGGGTTAPIKIAIMTCNDECTIADVLRVAKWGHVERASVSCNALGQGGRQGLTGQRLAEEQLALIGELIEHLPEAARELPPVERRILVSWPVADEWKQRIYDRALIPSKLNELVTLIVGTEDRAKFGAWVCLLTANRERTLPDAPRRSQFAIDPRGTPLVIARGGDRLRVFDSVLQDISANELPIAGHVVHCEFSGDGHLLGILSGERLRGGGEKLSILETSNWKQVFEINCARGEDPLLRFRFAPSSEHLTAWTKDRPVIYDTSTWTVQHKRAVDGEIWRQESPDKASAFAVKEDGTLWFRKTSDGSLIRIEENRKWLKTEFSPDSRYLAILTSGEKEGVRLRIWSTDDASLCSELTPYGLDWPARGGKGEIVLCWSPDSVYLAGASSASAFHFSRRLHLWNVRTGRHCADFEGSYSSLIGVGFGDSGKSLFAASPEQICRWDLDTGFLQIKEFESSVLPKP